MIPMFEVAEDLPTWEEVAGEADWSALLLGNGFSRNIWERFGYMSLFDTACSEELEDKLNHEDIDLFEHLDTHNFEAVLSALSTAITITKALGHDSDFLCRRMNSIRQALISAVYSVHLPWVEFTNDRRDRIVATFAKFKSVYSTNYDLLTYWSVMYDPGEFKDFFWSERFDITDTEIWGKCTKVLYLHGGLHLYRRPTGQTLKRSAEPFQNLLELFAQPFGDAVPLFVSEGTSEEKKASIYRSEYLSFAFSRFSVDAGPIVVFGQSLGDADQHLVDALRARKGRSIAISIKRHGQSIRQRKAELIAALPDSELYFFDAETHPLGAVDLRVEEDPE